MIDQRTDLHRAKLGMSIVATCIVQTLNETDPTFQDRFLERLSAAYYELKDNSEGDRIQQMEALTWVREMLTGFSHFTGQGEPYLSDYKPKG